MGFPGVVPPHRPPSNPVYGHSPTQDAASGYVNRDASEQDPSVPAIPGVNIAVVFPAIATGIFLAAMDNTIVVASYGRIGTELNELNRTSWQYLLTTTSFQPLYGKLSDIYGHAGCWVCWSLYADMLGRVCCVCCLVYATHVLHDVDFKCYLLPGVDFKYYLGGGMTIVSSILMTDIVPIWKRGTWQGIMNIIFGLGAAVGGHWAPLTLIAFLTVTFALHLPHAPIKVDFPGAFTLVLAIFSFLLSLDLSVNSISFPIFSPITLSILLGSVLLFVSFYHIEKSYSAEPFCPPDLVKRREILSPCTANFFCFASAMAVMFHVPLFFQAVLGSSAAAAGQRLLPMIFGGMLGSIGGGVYMQKTGKYYWLTFCAFLGLFLGAAGITSTLIALISNVTSAEQAVVTAISYLFRSLGSVLGLSLAAGLAQTVLRRRLLEKLGDGDEVLDIVRKVRRDWDYIGELEPDREVIVRKCYQDGITEAMFFAVILGFLCWVTSWGIREVKVKK
ncbi:MFS multidrug transporter [Tirmania nivea]|nr:MFS multidrug transporter [Tirmania nivea]